MKKLCLIFVVLLLFVFAGCGSDKPTGEKFPETEASDDDIIETDTDPDGETSDEEDSDAGISDDEDPETNDSADDETDDGLNDDDDPTGEDDEDQPEDEDQTGDEDQTEDEDQPEDEDQTVDEDQPGDEDQTDEDTEPTEEEKCTAAGGNWSASGGCTKTAQCKGKPENSEWNGDDSYTLHYTDGGWEEETAAAYNDLEAGLCRYKCNPNFLWDESGKKCFAVLGRICTNQTKCYKENGDETDCSSGDFSGQDAYFAAAGKCIQQRFEVKTPVSGQPVVIDLNTGLRWEQSYSSEQYNWGNAANHCKDLNEMNDFSGYAGYKDWRVPTNQEFFTIVDNGRSMPAFDGTVFPNMQGLYDNGLNLWTSQDMNDGSGYYFKLNYGDNYYREKTREFYVVCVSGVKMPEASFDAQENVVVDETTGLMWQKSYVSDKTWVQALEYCKKLGEDKYAGFDDWRLPNKNELASLLNLDKNTAPYSNFPDTPSEYFWSSSTLVDNTNYAWAVGFSYGYVNYYGKTSSYYVRCVR